MLMVDLCDTNVFFIFLFLFLYFYFIFLICLWLISVIQMFFKNFHFWLCSLHPCFIWYMQVYFNNNKKRSIHLLCLQIPSELCVKKQNMEKHIYLYHLQSMYYGKVSAHQIWNSISPKTLSYMCVNIDSPV